MTGCARFDDHSFYCHDSMTLYAVKLHEFRLDTHPSFWCSIIYIAKVYSFFFTFTSGLKKQIFMLVFCFLSIGKRDHKITTKQIQLKEAIRCTPPILLQVLKQGPTLKETKGRNCRTFSWGPPRLHTRELYYVARFMVFNHGWITSCFSMPQ